MRLLRQICLVLLQLVIEAILLGVLLGAMLAAPREKLYALLGGIMVIPIVLGLLGKYYLSRLLALIVLKHGRKWHYPALAAIAFVAHTTLVAMALWHGATARAHAVAAPYILVGACVVFANAAIGNRFLVRWCGQVMPAHF